MGYFGVRVKVISANPYRYGASLLRFTTIGSDPEFDIIESSKNANYGVIRFLHQLLRVLAELVDAFGGICGE